MSAKRSIWRVALIMAVGIMVMLAVSGCQPSDENRVSELEAQNQELQDRIEDLEAQISELEQGEEISRKPKEGWQQYFPEGEETTLLGESPESLRDTLGNPPFLIRSIAVNPEFNREIWVFTPFDEDPTGLYLFFKGNSLTEYRLDEFPGLPQSGLLDDEAFWMQ